jgi:hypothetical protein
MWVAFGNKLENKCLANSLEDFKRLYKLIKYVDS